MLKCYSSELILLKLPLWFYKYLMEMSPPLRFYSTISPFHVRLTQFSFIGLWCEMAGLFCLSCSSPLSAPGRHSNGINHSSHICHWGVFWPGKNSQSCDLHSALHCAERWLRCHIKAWKSWVNMQQRPELKLLLLKHRHIYRSHLFGAMTGVLPPHNGCMKKHKHRLYIMFSIHLSSQLLCNWGLLRHSSAHTWKRQQIYI